MRYFVDTSAWYALIDAGERQHSWVASAYEDAHRRRALFVTSDLVLGELYTLINSRFSTATVFWAFYDKLLASSSIRLLEVTSEQRDLAFTLLRTRQDKTYSFVDATSFVVMRAELIDTAFALDRHFAQEGFSVVPSLPDVLHDSTVSYNP